MTGLTVITWLRFFIWLALGLAVLIKTYGSRIDDMVVRHPSGLKAAILSDGVIRVGDPIALREEARLTTSPSL